MGDFSESFEDLLKAEEKAQLQHLKPGQKITGVIAGKKRRNVEWR